MSKTAVRRLGDTQKCPACGTEVDSGAYHCPRCRVYYCYRCRARVTDSDPQFQCGNQECEYHGKLVCGACDPEVVKEESPAVIPEHEDGWWPSLALLALILAIVALFYVPSFLQAVGIGVGAACLLGLGLHLLGVNVIGRMRQIVLPRKTTFNTCVCCEQPVKKVL